MVVDKEKNFYLRSLPAVDRVLREETLQELAKDVPHSLVVEGVQETIARYRKLIAALEDGKALGELDLTPAALAAEAAAIVREKTVPHLRRVINATGTVLHTNLGRAPLAAAALEALRQVASSYSNLELSLESGQRGSRHAHVEDLLCRLTGAEAAAVVNNNAAAVFLVLNTLASGREVIVARGQLVEIGGSFRIPEVMVQSGARLVEVGTTNKCYLRDYREALTEETALLMKVHTSNYQIIGFTASVSVEELSGLGRERGIPVVEDLGSGVLVDLSKYGLPKEPTVTESISSGADLVTFSGDKLLGGPQAGIILGQRKLVERVKRNQLARPLRVDKFTLAALEATLRLYLDEKRAVREIPVLRMLTYPLKVLEKRAMGLAAELKEILAGKASVELMPGTSRVGGGALPGVELPTSLVAVRPAANLTAESLAASLRRHSPPVVARIRDDRVLLDLRTVREEEEEELKGALACMAQNL